ncbi:glycerophosphoryl diester phosphodiesterase [Duganella sp. CF517]|uniref:glycerophosphodiester phosphodiesterase n=1 Tax=Duganella sp. CF517 TaxID=1881038 RepID=UPI0008AF45D0|nr:glycerophosphodiester phosphodiesterase family protein [Duganella sp. CF517]SEO17117.1 glycerophosphoryl diester phosphodiesterase [Duganella sp. CF517]
MVITRKKNKRAASLLAWTLMLALAAQPAGAACLGMQVHAHRGAVAGAPENSLSALRAAYDGGWDGVETDMQMLADQRWVIHHDLLTGRVVQTDLPRQARQLTSADWRAAQMKLRGNTTGEPPPFVSDVTALASGYPQRALNAEIKEVAPCAQVQALVRQFQQEMAHGNWFMTSGLVGNLRCARQADAAGYLGLLVFDGRNAEAAGANGVTRYIASRARAPRLDQAWLATVKRDVGMPVGVHVDARSLDANPALLSDAAMMKMPVFVYAVEGDAALAAALKRARQRDGRWPSGVIVDESAPAFCARLQ